MQDALAFAREFIAAEHALWTECYSERDTERWHAKRAAFTGRYYDPDIPVSIHRRRVTDDAWFEAAKGYLRALQERLLFRVQEFAHPTYGQVYAAELSSVDLGSDEPFERIVFAMQDGRFLILESCMTDLEGDFDHLSGRELYDELWDLRAEVRFLPTRGGHEEVRGRGARDG